MSWEQFAGTDDPARRHCERCGEDVHACDTIEAAEAHARLGHCIAVSHELVYQRGGDLRAMRGRPEHPVWVWAARLFGR
jgi:hypothetical protein